MTDKKTTFYGISGEAVQSLTLLLPPPFNFIALAVGFVVKGTAWYMAKDRTPSAEEVASAIPNAPLK